MRNGAEASHGLCRGQAPMYAAQMVRDQLLTHVQAKRISRLCECRSWSASVWSVKFPRPA